MIHQLTYIYIPVTNVIKPSANQLPSAYSTTCNCKCHQYSFSFW